MRLIKKPLVVICSILVVAGIAGGKKGQDLITVPPPSLKNDYLLSHLPEAKLRVDSSRIILADREKTSLVSDVLILGEAQPWHGVAFQSEFILDAYRSAPALRLVEDVSLNLSKTIKGVESTGLSYLLVYRPQGYQGEFQMELGSFVKQGGQYALELFTENTESQIKIVRSASGLQLNLDRGLEVAELVILEQPLSDLQARNIKDSLYRKWVNRSGIQ